MNQRKLDRELAFAFNKGDTEKAQQLVALGADINATGKWSGDATLLWLAVNAAGQEIYEDFRKLMAGLDEFFDTPRRDHGAPREQFLRGLKWLLEAKVDVNKPSHGGTPLRIAVRWRDVEVVKLLLASGANPNAETCTVLSKLAKKVGRKMVPGYWKTVLHEAVEQGSLPIVEALLAAGADPDRTDHEGKTARTIAQEKGSRDMVALLQHSRRQSPRPGSAGA